MKVFKQYSVKYIFFGSFFLFMLSVFIVLILVSYHFSVREVVQKTAEHQEKYLRLISDDIGSNLESLYDYSIVMSRQQTFRDLLKDIDYGFERSNTISTLTSDYSNIIYSVPALHSIEIYIENPPIDNLYYPVRYDSLARVLKQPWLEKIDKVNSTWLGKRKVNTIAGEQEVISLGRRINTPRGNLQSVLIVNIDLVIIEGWLRSNSEKSNLILLSNQNEVISRIGETKIQDDFSEDILGKYKNQLLEQKAKELEVTHKGSEYIVVASSISEVDWTLMEITSLNDLTPGIKNMIGYLVLVGVVSIFIAFIGTLFLTKRFTDPILLLTRVMSQSQVSESKNNLPNDYKNEFGKLFKGYKELIDRSELLYKSLIEQHHRQREAELKALQANINPHFLYNTLDQLNWIAIERDHYDMSEMLELLGKMLRVGLSKGESIISLEQELKYLDYYLQIQKIQLGDRLVYTVEAPKYLLHYFIPKLTFQPFVENAIIHGFHNERYGEIRIRIEERQNHLVCQIDDNGIGFDNLNEDKVKMDTGGYGIQNVKERLDVYFGHEASVFVREKAEGGVNVSITIPKINDNRMIQQTRSNFFDLKE